MLQGQDAPLENLTEAQRIAFNLSIDLMKASYAKLNA
jgi:hypothetical protein